MSGVYGFFEVFYVFILMGNNNGSVFVGFVVDMMFINMVGVVMMLFVCFILFVVVFYLV